MENPEQVLSRNEAARNAELAKLDAKRKSVGLSRSESGRFDALRTYPPSKLAEWGIIR